MKKIVLITAAVLIMLTAAACSREGFKESLEQGNSGKGEQGQTQQAQQQIDSEEYIFDLDTDEYEENNCFYYYARPNAAAEAAESSAKRISDELDGLVKSMAEAAAAGREYESVSIYDAITCNDGKYFSVLYEIEISLKDETEESYALGLVFDSVTGKRVMLDELKDADTFVTLILDEQLSKIPGKKEELKASKREYLREQGDEKLKERLLAADSLEELLDASYFVDGDQLTAFFAADQELGGVIEISVDL